MSLKSIIILLIVTGSFFEPFKNVFADDAVPGDKNSTPEDKNSTPGDKNSTPEDKNSTPGDKNSTPEDKNSTPEEKATDAADATAGETPADETPTDAEQPGSADDKPPEESNKKIEQFIIVNRTEVEKKCKQVGKCWASDKLLPICAGDKVVYQNPGVFMCSQRCSSLYELEHFCYLREGETEDPNKMCGNCPKAIQAIRDAQA